jgi:hypothetical protein
MNEKMEQPIISSMKNEKIEFSRSGSKSMAQKDLDILYKEREQRVMDTSTTLDNTRPENVKAMVEFTKEYGAY